MWWDRGFDGGRVWGIGNIWGFPHFGESDAVEVPLHGKAGRVNTFWIMLDIFWELSHDENYLPVCVRCCQFPCQATSAAAPVSLTLMIINDTLSLHCAQLQGKATSTAPPPSLCLGHYEKDQVLPWCCWGAAHPFRITVVRNKQSLCFPCDFSSLTVCFCLWIFSFLRKGTYFPYLWLFLCHP